MERGHPVRKIVHLNQKVLAKLEIIAKGMEKDRNLCYKSAAEIRTDLQRLKRDTSMPQTTRQSSAVPIEQLRELHQSQILDFNLKSEI